MKVIALTHFICRLLYTPTPQTVYLLPRHTQKKKHLENSSHNPYQVYEKKLPANEIKSLNLFTFFLVWLNLSTPERVFAFLFLGQVEVV